MTDIFDLFKKISSSSSSTQGAPEFLVAGLGNPGKEYAFTRHNAGFLAMDYLTEKRNLGDLRTSRFKSLVLQTEIGGHKVLLMKPQTYMNASGEAVREAADFYKIPPEKILVISDDVAQEPGRMRIRRSGSDGGQKGLRSIIEHLGTDAFPRIRIGVGAKPRPDYPMADWVLGRIPEEHQKPIFSILGCVSDAVPMILDGRFDDAMSKFNGVQF
ncbi:MAG: aminoacyl-tRNA hydrolase [Ruminococcaceae bacterium]|jgi:PTH1 family peptidyl-tRNA hydrolase|nr:aminoacyl-tRNA hydrolase [Oscillospiraceae bacterium]